MERSSGGTASVSIPQSSPSPAENLARLSRRRWFARAGAGMAGCLLLGTGRLPQASTAGELLPAAAPRLHLLDGTSQPATALRLDRQGRLFWQSAGAVKQGL